MFSKLFSKKKSAPVRAVSASTKSPSQQTPSLVAPALLASDKVKHELKSTVLSDSQSESLFYEYLFADAGKAQAVNALEEDILAKVNALLDNPEQTLKSFPPLPRSISKLVDVLGNDDFVLMDFLDIVKEEPPVASIIIKMANSAQYNTSGKPVVDLTKAFMLIGAEGIKETVLNGFIRQFTQIKSVYFKAFGDKIWQHSQDTANISKRLAQAKHADKEAGFFIGLTHDMGKIVIFRIMVDAFRVADPEHQPGSAIFKQLLSEKSLLLTLALAKFWKMPANVSTAIYDLLGQGQEPPATALGEALCEANLISELKLIMGAKRLSSQQLQAEIDKAHFSQEATQIIDEVFVFDEEE